MDEREAIARLQRGDIAGLEALVARYQTEATRVAQLITRNRALAEDVVQSAFVRVYERIEQFDASRPFAPWFFRIVSNDAINAAQRSSRQISLTARPEGGNLDQLPDIAPGPDELLATLEQFDSVTAALDQLSPEQRCYVGLKDHAAALRSSTRPQRLRETNCPHRPPQVFS
ncbi:MAG TPA: RNA polymerase sigma factor [Nitrolancea sp.]|nr:RNA polymerase sigma factor [Nitrolancea sp.]